MIDALVNLAVIALAWEAPAIYAWGISAKALWDQYVGGTPEETWVPVEYTPSVVPAVGYFAYPESAPGNAIDLGSTLVGYDCHETVRRVGEMTLYEALGAIHKVAVNDARLLFSATNGNTVVDTTYIATQETEVLGECDAAILALTSVPAKYGSITWDNDPWVYPRLGSLVFGVGGGWDERQKVEMVSGLYVPRNIGRADVVRVRLKPGVEATLYTVDMQVLC